MVGNKNSGGKRVGAGRKHTRYVVSLPSLSSDELYAPSLTAALLADVARLDALRNRKRQEWIEAGKPARVEGQPYEWERVEARRRQVWTAFQYYTEHEKAPNPD